MPTTAVVQTPKSQERPNGGALSAGAPHGPNRGWGVLSGVPVDPGGLGDLNGDGVFDVWDMVRIRNIALNNPPLPTPAELVDADLDVDADVDWDDVLVSHQIALRKRSIPEEIGPNGGTLAVGPTELTIPAGVVDDAIVIAAVRVERHEISEIVPTFDWSAPHLQDREFMGGFALEFSAAPPPGFTFRLTEPFGGDPSVFDEGLNALYQVVPDKNGDGIAEIVKLADLRLDTGSFSGLLATSATDIVVTTADPQDVAISFEGGASSAQGFPGESVDILSSHLISESWAGSAVVSIRSEQTGDLYQFQSTGLVFAGESRDSILGLKFTIPLFPPGDYVLHAYWSNLTGFVGPLSLHVLADTPPGNPDAVIIAAFDTLSSFLDVLLDPGHRATADARGILLDGGGLIDLRDSLLAQDLTSREIVAAAFIRATQGGSLMRRSSCDGALYRQCLEEYAAVECGWQSPENELRCAQCAQNASVCVGDIFWQTLAMSAVVGGAGLLVVPFTYPAYVLAGLGIGFSLGARAHDSDVLKDVDCGSFTGDPYQCLRCSFESPVAALLYPPPPAPTPQREVFMCDHSPRCDVKLTRPTRAPGLVPNQSPLATWTGSTDSSPVVPPWDWNPPTGTVIGTSNPFTAPTVVDARGGITLQIRQQDMGDEFTLVGHDPVSGVRIDTLWKGTGADILEAGGVPLAGLWMSPLGPDSSVTLIKPLTNGSLLHDTVQSWERMEYTFLVSQWPVSVPIDICISHLGSVADVRLLSPSGQEIVGDSASIHQYSLSDFDPPAPGMYRLNLRMHSSELDTKEMKVHVLVGGCPLPEGLPLTCFCPEFNATVSGGDNVVVGCFNISPWWTVTVDPSASIGLQKWSGISSLCISPLDPTCGSLHGVGSIAEPITLRLEGQ